MLTKLIILDLPELLLDRGFWESKLNPTLRSNFWFGLSNPVWFDRGLKAATNGLLWSNIPGPMLDLPWAIPGSLDGPRNWFSSDEGFSGQMPGPEVDFGLGSGPGVCPVWVVFSGKFLKEWKKRENFVFFYFKCKNCKNVWPFYYNYYWN